MCTVVQPMKNWFIVDFCGNWRMLLTVSSKNSSFMHLPIAYYEKNWKKCKSKKKVFGVNKHFKPGSRLHLTSPNFLEGSSKIISACMSQKISLWTLTLGPEKCVHYYLNLAMDITSMHLTLFVFCSRQSCTIYITVMQLYAQSCSDCIQSCTGVIFMFFPIFGTEK